MTILIFAMTAFFIGVLLGLCFKVYILLPVIAGSLAAIVGAGFKYEISIGFILFVIFLGITALQMGYLLGAVIGANVADAHRRKRRPGISATAQRLFRQSQT
jgi:hypothetical protein